MILGVIQWGEMITILMIGIALGADAFSLGIGMGMGGIRLLTVLKVSIIIGIFHVIMPLIGIAAGLFLTSVVGNVASYLGGGILIALGIHMLWNAYFNEEESPLLKTSFWGIMLFSFSVSLDALSVGFSFGLFNVNIVMAVVTFGVISMVLSMCGLLLGRRVGGWMGAYSEIIGGLILLAFGIKFLL
ncbi:manganese efflux pump MntP family protein [Aneurinibacillus sp. Ricciae_BoGa-3]|uniref:manganese efflux pump MntP n=1 Tax=Aneurinibacillus sp. Ricciae_BoGa-3 TaxID=3022697 RepID=UPI0023409851|nr:manganese efflux pump MntP family protein [Aneurinibacillus sp. Ricciae_BoGa-3]WCK54361.1 manganese efflux pump MntP family protein [Aneurinibacillus sp. Ricciae_BoGa-3]